MRTLQLLDGPKMEFPPGVGKPAVRSVRGSSSSLGAVVDVGKEVHRGPQAGSGVDRGGTKTRVGTTSRMGGVQRWCYHPDGSPQEGPRETTCQRGDGPFGHLLQGDQAEGPGEHE